VLPVLGIIPGIGSWSTNCGIVVGSNEPPGTGEGLGAMAGAAATGVTDDVIRRSTMNIAKKIALYFFTLYPPEYFTNIVNV
jgi:hypothetical protein